MKQELSVVLLHYWNHSLIEVSMKITLLSHKNAANLAFPLGPFHLYGDKEPGNVTDYYMQNVWYPVLLLRVTQAILPRDARKWKTITSKN